MDKTKHTNIRNLLKKFKIIRSRYQDRPKYHNKDFEDMPKEFKPEVENREHNKGDVWLDLDRPLG